MEVGLIGVTGVAVLSRVVVECRIARELVPIPRRPLVERHALGRVTKPERATKILVQVNFAHNILCGFLELLTLTFLLELGLIPIRCCS